MDEGVEYILPDTESSADADGTNTRLQIIF